MKSIHANVHAIWDDATQKWVVAVMTNDMGNSHYEEMEFPASVAEDEVIVFAVGQRYGFEMGKNGEE